MILLLDAGNTRTKWWLHDTGLEGVVARGEEGLLPKRILESTSADAITEIRVASVVPPEVTHELASQFRRELGVRVIFASVKARCAGITPVYSDLSKLGVDRWLAMLAAYNTSGAAGCIVIDAGSAVTVDFVATQGLHRGGLILPGVQTMAKALFANTRGVAVESLTLPQTWKPGCDTLSCVEQGVAAAFKGLLSEIRKYSESALEKESEKPAIVVTGGDAAWFLGALSGAAIHEPRLVLKGLLYINDK